MRYGNDSNYQFIAASVRRLEKRRQASTRRLGSMRLIPHTLRTADALVGLGFSCDGKPDQGAGADEGVRPLRVMW